MNYYLAIKKNEIMPFVARQMWMDLDGGHYTKHSKSDGERQISHDLTYTWNLKNK